MTWTLFVLSCIISIVIAQNYTFTSEDLEFLPPDVQQSFERKCEKNGHPEVSITNVYQTFLFCNIAVLGTDAMPEFKVAMMLDVSKGVCNIIRKTKCFHEMMETIKPCFSAEEQKSFKTIFKIKNELTEFICYKDGDRITKFIAEGGQKCWKDKQEALKTCFNQANGAQTRDNLDLEITEEDCKILTKLQHCVVSVLKTCNTPTATNFIDSLFNVVREATPCKDANSARSFAVTPGAVIMALIAAILV